MSSWFEQLGEFVAPSPEKGKQGKSVNAPNQFAAESLVDCSRVFVKNDSYGGAGAFATCNIRNGELVEKGIVRRLTNVDGNENPYVFTWSDVVPSPTWAVGSGCSTFYNTAAEDKANTHMKRIYDEDRFEIYATKEIAAGEELLHVYKSKKWRQCFKPLNDDAATSSSSEAVNVSEKKEETAPLVTGEPMEDSSALAEPAEASTPAAPSAGQKDTLLNAFFDAPVKVAKAD